MLSLLSLASAALYWQLEVDMALAALLEAGCMSLWLSLSILNQTKRICDGEKMCSSLKKKPITDYGVF